MKLIMASQFFCPECRTDYLQTWDVKSKNKYILLHHRDLEYRECSHKGEIVTMLPQIVELDERGRITLADGRRSKIA